jgi:anthranilate phosphoribosyltransferase
LEEIQGGTPEENAKILLKVLLGEPGASRDVILLNAAAVFTAAEKVSTLRDGMEMAKESIDSGMAIKKLKEFIQFSNHMG